MARRKKSWVSPSRPNSDINVTPLVDVVLVLLIIFMVVTPLLEKDIEVRVPDKTEEQQPDDPNVDQLVVQLDAQGLILINSHPCAGDQYIETLRNLLRSRKADDKLVFFMADEKTNYGKFVAALDGARQAGADPLGMMTEPLENQVPAPAPAPPAPPAP